jgi:hypothetical protein
VWIAQLKIYCHNAVGVANRFGEGKVKDIKERVDTIF